MPGKKREREVHVPARERQSPVAAAGFGTLGHAHLLAFGQMGGIGGRGDQSYAVGLLVVLQRISFGL